MKNKFAYILLIISMFFWATNFYVVKIAMQSYSPEAVAFWRYLVGAITLVLIGYIQFGQKFSLFRFTSKAYWYMFLTSLFGVFLTIYFFNKGLTTTSAVNGSLIIATSPAITAIMAIFFLDNRIKLIQWFAIFLSFTGVAVILVKGDINQLIELQFEAGDAYIVAMALVFSASQIIVSRYLGDVDATIMTTISSIIALILFAIMSFSELVTVAVPTSFDFWASILFMGVLSTGIAYTAFYYCIVKLGATTTSLYMNLVPFFVILLSFPFGESIAISQILGGLIVITGLVLFGRSKK